MPSINGLFAREILDSRGIPTIECHIWLDTGQYQISSVPTGTSKGKYEAVELRDGDATGGNRLGVSLAVENINQHISGSIIGLDPTKQTDIDQILVNLDGTPNKSKLGANALLAVSQAVMKIGAASVNLPLYSYIQQKYQLTPQLIIPNCIYTLINGGEHGADNLDIQEFQVIPASHLNYTASLSMASQLFKQLEEVLISKGAVHSVGIVGGFTPNLFNNTDAFEILIETIKTSPYTFAQDLFFGTDMAAQTLYKGGKYTLKDKSNAYSAKELFEYYKSLRQTYHVFYIEDPFQDDDEDSWKQITAELGATTMIVGDSLLSTNAERLQKAIADKLCNGILIKPNEVGTISETIEVIQQAKAANMHIIVSHRSGETNDDFIADFAVGVGANYVKFGPPNRGERVAKYNRLSWIQHELTYMKQTTMAPPATDATAIPDPSPVTPASV